MEDTRTVTHENGYSAVLYGESSLIIRYQGKEVMHTGFRNVNTEEEVMELLGGYPEFRERLKALVQSEVEE